MRFFFYGTLIAGSGNPVARAIHARLCPVGPATTKGRLHAIPDPDGWYPALLPGTGTVHGRLYETAADFAAADLALLDAYEDFDPARPAASLYRREPVIVLEAGGAEGPAEAYRFNRSLPADALPVPGGDFARWLAARGEAGFGCGED